MSFDRSSRRESDSIDPTSSAKEGSAVRYVLYGLLVIYLALGGMLAALAIENGSTLLIGVHLTFFRWQSLTVPVGALLVLSCVLGALLLYVVTVLSAWRERRELARLRKRVAELEQVQRTGIPDGNGGAQQSPPPLLVPMPGMHRPQPPSALKRQQ